MAQLRIVDVTDLGGFERVPPCADARFDHRTCDYWEDPERGSKLSRPALLTASSAPAPRRPAPDDNPFAPPARKGVDNPFRPQSLSAELGPREGDDLFGTPAFNPFAPQARRETPLRVGVPRKLALLDRGRGVFGSYAKVALLGEEAVAYAQFGPLSAYPRAIRLRDLYPQLPQAPPPAVITCIATTSEGRHQGYAMDLVAEICRDLAGRGFAAVEAYPDLTRPQDEISAARPAFWLVCGFHVAVDDARFPVMRRELD